MRAVMLLVLAACGRIEFASSVDGSIDSPSDTLLGHDEDGDGKPDSVDLCPHVATNENADGDSDGVGDACDPNPTIGGENYLLFATLQPGDHPFLSLAGWTQEADAVSYNQQNGSLYIDRTVFNVRIDFGFEIRGIVGLAADQHQLASGIEKPEPFYFVELNENGSVRDAGVWSYDATNGYQFLGGENHNGVHPGRGLLRYDADATANQFSLLTGWTNELYMGTAATATYDGGGPIRVTVNGLDIALLYVALIGSP